jgi:hypothetical protein
MESPFPPSLGSSCSPGSDPPDLFSIELGEPEIAIGARRDAVRMDDWGKGELSDRAIGRDAPDLVPTVLSEPEVAIRASCDATRAASGIRKRELGDRATGRDAPDLAPTVLGEPEVAIGAFRDGLRMASGSRKGERGDRARPRRCPTSTFVYQSQSNATGRNEHEAGERDEKPLVRRPEHPRRSRPA